MQIPANVVDLHVHIQPWQQIRDAPRRTIESGRTDVDDILRYQAEPKAFAAHVREQGLARVGLINYVAPNLMGFDASCNDWIAAYRDVDPSTFVAWGGVHPGYCDDVPAEMARLLDELKIDGIKIHPPHQEFRANAYRTMGMPGLAEVYAACEERDVPVMIHTGTSVFPGARASYGDPMDVDDVAIDFPNLRIVMAHCGRPFWYEQAFFVARRHANVWLELSGIPPLQLPEKLPRLEVVADKVLWGTDWPSPGVRAIRGNLETFCGLPGYSDILKHKVLVENPNRLFPPR
ncbi:MAG: amidohydrolase family protein [Planctomycetota bacterium]|jgi:predicted TIM-barrel fold metal-dependent hydrolase